jgi:hypothetical protein
MQQNIPVDRAQRLQQIFQEFVNVKLKYQNLSNLRPPFNQAENQSVINLLQEVSPILQTANDTQDRQNYWNTIIVLQQYYTQFRDGLPAVIQRIKNYSQPIGNNLAEFRNRLLAYENFDIVDVNNSLANALQAGQAAAAAENNNDNYVAFRDHLNTFYQHIDQAKNVLTNQYQIVLADIQNKVNNVEQRENAVFLQVQNTKRAVIEGYRATIEQLRNELPAPAGEIQTIGDRLITIRNRFADIEGRLVPYEQQVAYVNRLLDLQPIGVNIQQLAWNTPLNNNNIHVKSITIGQLPLQIFTAIVNCTRQNGKYFFNGSINVNGRLYTFMNGNRIGGGSYGTVVGTNAANRVLKFQDFNNESLREGILHHMLYQTDQNATVKIFGMYRIRILNLTTHTLNTWMMYILERCNGGTFGQNIELAVNQDARRQIFVDSLRPIAQKLQIYQSKLSFNHTDLHSLNILQCGANYKLNDFGFSRIKLIHPAHNNWTIAVKMDNQGPEYAYKLGRDITHITTSLRNAYVIDGALVNQILFTPLHPPNVWSQLRQLHFANGNPIPHQVYTWFNGNENLPASPAQVLAFYPAPAGGFRKIKTKTKRSNLKLKKKKTIKKHSVDKCRQKKLK